MYGFPSASSSTPLTPKQVFLKQWADAQNITGNNAEANDEQRNEYRHRCVDNEIMSMCIEESTNVWQIGDKEKVQYVDVKGTSAYILQRTADNRTFREIVLIMAEIHKDDSQKT